MHNIHEEAPIIMTTRWAMSYLSGPLSRTQIEGLCKDYQSNTDSPATDNLSVQTDDAIGLKHVNLPNEINQYFLPPTQIVTDSSALVYQPTLMGLLDVHYEDSKSDTRFSVKQAFTTPFSDGAIAIDWRNACELFAERPDQLALIDDKQPDGSRLIEPLSVASQKGFYKDWEKALTLWVRQNRPLSLLTLSALKLYSQPNESESQFRQRIALQLREARDSEVEKLRETFAKKIATLENKLERAELKVQKEEEQASGKAMNAIIGAGTAIFSAFFSRKKVSVTNARRLGSAISKAKGALNERNDIGFAKQQVESIQTDIDNLSAQFEKEQQAISQRFEIGNAELEQVQLYPKATGVQVIAFGIAWQPGIIVDGAWRSV